MAGADTGILELPYEATAAIVDKRFVKLSGDQTIVQCGVAGELALGVAKTPISTSNFQGTNEVTAGKGTAVQILGVAWVEAGAAVSRGAEVTTDTSGRAVTAATTNRVLGYCLKGTTTGAGDWILVLLAGGFGRILP